MWSDIKSNCLQRAAETGLFLLPPQSGISASEMVQIHAKALLKDCILWCSWKAGRLWITRKSMLLSWNSSTVTRAGKQLKLLKSSTASLSREPTTGLLSGKISGVIYTAPWGWDAEALVVYVSLLGIYSPIMTAWICIARVEGAAYPPGAVARCESSCLHLYLISFGISILYVTIGARHIHDHYLLEC